MSEKNIPNKPARIVSRLRRTYTPGESPTSVVSGTCKRCCSVTDSDSVSGTADIRNTKKRSRKSKPVQSNKILNYFSVVVPKKSVPETVVRESGCSQTSSGSQESLKQNTLNLGDKTPVEQTTDVCTDACTQGFEGNSLRSEQYLRGVQEQRDHLEKGEVSRCATSSDRYGPLCSGAVIVEEEPNHFQKLPQEVLENIFSHLPIMDLYLNLTLVCKSWKRIIAHQRFLKWRKCYFQILRGDEYRRNEMLQKMAQNEIHCDSAPSALLSLIRSMKNFRPVSSHNIFQYFYGQSLYQSALEVIRCKLPECIYDQEPDCWCLITCMVLLSKTVDQVYSTLINLAKTQCTVLDLTECLYCIASFLFILKETINQEVWTGIHYRVYYSLYLYENQSTVTCDQLKNTFSNKTGQQSLYKYSSSETKIEYTHEQLQIANENLNNGEIMKIVAFAGSGKTTTLMKYTQLRPNLTFLLIVYNKSTQQHCSKQFAPNVTCKTIHALARGSKIGKKYAKKIDRLDVSDIVSVIPWRKDELGIYVHAKFVLKTITAFMSSVDSEISLSHVPPVSMNKLGVMEALSGNIRQHILSDARLVWEKAIDVNDMSIMLPHDGYLKLYQLGMPKIVGCDVILLDEAQDQTPAAIDIIVNQEQPKILVGDPHQQIYGFRGSVNAMELVTATKTYYLTQSFRFGPEIAFLANSCLWLLKKVRNKILVGNANKDTTEGNSTGQLTVISRTNFTLFSEAVKRCCYNNENIRIAFVGGISGFGFDMLEDIYALSLSPAERRKDNLAIKHKLIAKFSNIQDLDQYGKKTNDYELLGKIKIVMTYHYQLPSHISKIKAKVVNDLHLADVILTTAHKAKGLEFNNVQVTNDFITEIFNSSVTPDIPDDEYNLLYVAITRAKRSLKLSPVLEHLLKLSGEDHKQNLVERLLAVPSAIHRQVACD